MNISIGYSDFTRLCRVEDPENWCGWLSVRSDGVYIKAPPAELTAEERSTLSEHSEGNLTEPGLRFPCSLHQLRHFLESQGTYGCIDAFDMADWVASQEEKADTADPGYLGIESGARPLPRTRIVQITNVLESVCRLSEKDLEISELADVLNRVYDGDSMMLYLWVGHGMAEAIVGNVDDKYSGYNRRADIICDFFNSRYWKNPENTVGRYDANCYVVTKEDGLRIAQRLWDFFYPDRPRIIRQEDIDQSSPSQSEHNDTRIAEESFSDDPRWPEELGIALTVWNAARNQAEESGKRIGVFIKDWLKDQYPGDSLSKEAHKRIAIVANWDKDPGR